MKTLSSYSIVNTVKWRYKKSYLKTKYIFRMKGAVGPSNATFTYIVTESR